jgi:hypothetical protein
MSSSQELTDIIASLSEYFSLIQANLDDATEPLPSYEDYVEDLVYNDLLTDALVGVTKGASYATGAIVDTIHLANAIEREFAMRGKLRIQYYSDAEQDVGKVSDYLNFMEGSYMSYIRGTSTDQFKE